MEKESGKEEQGISTRIVVVVALLALVLLGGLWLFGGGDEGSSTLDEQEEEAFAEVDLVESVTKERAEDIQQNVITERVREKAKAAEVGDQGVPVGLNVF